MLKNVIIKFLSAVLILLAIIYYRYGRSHYEKLGESIIFKNEKIEIKVITRHEYLPLHYSGDAYSIACRTNQTENFKEQTNQFIENGWTTVPSHALHCDITDGIKCNHQKLAEEAKNYIGIFENSTVTSITENGIFVSFNGCQSFAHWNNSSLKNIGPNKIFITNLKASDKGIISFNVSLDNLKNEIAYTIESLDFGKTWVTK